MTKELIVIEHMYNNENYTEADFKDIEGKVFVSVDNILNEQLVFTLQNGDRYVLYHEQDCCENVEIIDICGDLSDLTHTPIITAEEREDEYQENEDEYGTETWTFYKIATIKGSVTMRWKGESNGYYSEAVDFTLIKKENEK